MNPGELWTRFKDTLCVAPSIDLSLDARPIPEVDDLVSLALDLWAADQGYQRIEPGLAGI